MKHLSIINEYQIKINAQIPVLQSTWVLGTHFHHNLSDSVQNLLSRQCEKTSGGHQLIDHLGPDLSILPNPITRRKLLVCQTHQQQLSTSGGCFTRVLNRCAMGIAFLDRDRYPINYPSVREVPEKKLAYVNILQNQILNNTIPISDTASMGPKTDTRACQSVSCILPMELTTFITMPSYT